MIDIENYDKKVSSVSKIMEEAYRKQRENCLCVVEKSTEEKENISHIMHDAVKNLSLYKHDNHLGKEAVSTNYKVIFFIYTIDII